FGRIDCMGAPNLNAVSPQNEIVATIKVFSIIPQSLRLPILQTSVTGHWSHSRKGCLMRRSALLIYTGLALACFSGCHSHWWHRKHHKWADYTNYEGCGCDSAIAAPFE